LTTGRKIPRPAVIHQNNDWNAPVTRRVKDFDIEAAKQRVARFAHHHHCFAAGEENG
jgi:hypothetical protein